MSEAPASEMQQEIRSLVDDYRDRCLWFLRRDYYPTSSEEIRSVMDAIQRNGDQEAFRRARKIEQWLSHHSSATSAGS